MTDDKIVCGLYTRVSSKGQMEGEYNSLETQQERLEAYCKSRGYQVYRVYVDGGFSGSTTERPGLRQLLDDIRDRKIQCVLAYKIDRIARSVRDFHNLVDYFDSYGVSFVSITQSFDTQSAMGRLLRNILCDFAQFEREMIADRTRDKMQQRAQKGYWNGGRPPYGYQKANKRLEVDPVESKRVQFIFETFAKRPSLAALRDELNRRGWFTRAGSKWGKTSVDSIVRNPVYVGKVQSKGNLYEGMHQPILAEDLFNYVQSLRRDRTHVESRIERVFLLKGLLRCADCGSIMTPHYTQKRRKDGSVNRIPYYRCTRTMHLNNGVCSVKSVNANEIERVVVADLAELADSDHLLIRSIDDLNRQVESQLKPMEQERAALRARVDEVETELDNLVRALGKGRILVGRLEKAVETGEREIAIAKSRIETLTRQINEQTVAAYDAELVRKHLADFRACFESLDSAGQAEALNCVLREVVVDRDRLTLEIFELPEFIPGSQNRTRKHPRQDSNLLPSA